MKREVERFRSDSSLHAYLKKHPKFLLPETGMETWTFIRSCFRKWATGGFLTRRVILLKEFTDFFNCFLLLSSRTELKFLQSLLEDSKDETKIITGFQSAIKRALTNTEDRDFPGYGYRKINLPLLLSHKKRLSSGLENLKRARDRGKKEILHLKAAMASCSRDLEGRHRSAACKRRIITLGDKVLKACELIHYRSREQEIVDAIIEITGGTRKSFIKAGGALQGKVSFLRRDISEISGKFEKLDSLWEKLSEILVKISMTEDRLEKTRDLILSRRELNCRFLKRLEACREKMMSLREQSSGIDELLGGLSRNPAGISRCRDQVMLTRKALLQCQKSRRRLHEQFAAIRRDQTNQLEKYEALLNEGMDLEAGRSFYLAALSKIARAGRVKIHALHQKMVEAIISLAELTLVLDRFILEHPGLTKMFEKQLSLLKKMGMEIETRRKVSLEWVQTIAHLQKEGEALLVPVKAGTRLKAVRNDSEFEQCLSVLPGKEEISGLLKRNYAQEKEIKEFELINMSHIIATDCPEPRGKGAVRQDHASLQSVSLSRRDGERNSRLSRIIHWANRKRLRRQAEHRMEYPGTRRSLTAGRMLTLLIPVIGFGYYTHVPSQRADANMSSYLDDRPDLTVYWEEVLGEKAPGRRTLRARMYEPEKMSSVSGPQRDLKRQWEVFKPVLEDFSLHWSGNGDPILINRQGRIPDSRSLECFHLFEKIRRELHAESSGFFRRLYMDLVELGSAPRDAVTFILDRESVNAVFPERRKNFRYIGRNQPIRDLETMNRDKFVRNISPYIMSMYSRYSKNLGLKVPVDLPSYARTLAEDIFFSAKIFDVPVTIMVCIAHQETYFMNILGDALKSAGPFQIYQPTSQLIEGQLREMGLRMQGRIQKLEDHITLSTFMAAFHFATLMKQYSSYQADTNGAGIHGIATNLDKSLKRYNGHASYPVKVRQKNHRLRRYLKTRENIFFKA